MCTDQISPRMLFSKSWTSSKLAVQCSRPCLAAMEGIYRGILHRIEQQGYNVFAGRARLSAWQKLSVAASAWVRYSRGAARPW